MCFGTLCARSTGYIPDGKECTEIWFETDGTGAGSGFSNVHDWLVNRPDIS